MAIELLSTEFQIWSHYIQEISGIHIDESKRYLLETRLYPLIVEYKCETFTDLYHKSRAKGLIQEKVIDAISTHETYFFRHPKLYQELPGIVENMLSSNPHEISVWSAACSTGQELISAAITLEKTQCFQKLIKRYIGTDLSESVLARAKKATFNNIEISRGLSECDRDLFFNKSADGSSWKLSENLLSQFSFIKLNLISAQSDFGKFDVVFCCNVAIYFRPEVQKKMFANVIARMKPKGILFLGLSESLVGVNSQVEVKEKNGVIYYQKI